MPLVNPDEPIQERPPLTAEQVQYMQDAAAQRNYERKQDDVLALLLIGIAIVALYFAAPHVWRFLRRLVRLVDRALYAVGIDTRRIAARWKERK